MMERNDPIKSSIASSQKETVQGSGESLYRSVVDSLTGHALFAISPAGDVMTWNAGAENIFGFTKAEIIGRSAALLFTAEDAAAGLPQNELADARRGSWAGPDRWHLRKDGTRFWGRNVVLPLHDGGGTPIGFTKLIADISANHAAHEAQRASEERLRRLIERAPESAIFSLAADGSIVSWNAVAQTIFGYADREIIGRQFAQLFAPEDIANSVPEIVLRKVTALEASDEERWFVRKDGSRFLGSEKITRLAPGANGVARDVVRVADDISARYRLTEELRRRASLDELTQLPNRGTFFEHVRRAIAAIKRRPSNLFAIMFIDLDHFKQVNDTYGHIVADHLLAITARRLEACARSEDIVARIGGDEFAVLLNGINDIADANDAADRISAQMRKPAPIDSRILEVTVSVGIALGDPRYDRPEEILRDADAAMYAAKDGGRARSMVFTNDFPRAGG